MPDKDDIRVRIEDVTKRFGDRVALAAIASEVRAGHVTGLVGPDGAGKTTLLRLIAGLLLPDAGRITVCGLDTRGPPSALHEIVSYMPQRFGLYEDLTVVENLTLYAELRSVTGAERARAFERLLAFTDLGAFTTRRAGKLSGGMKQKLGIACALIHTPRVLLLDEPSVGVDPIARRELWQMVRSLVDQGIGVVWSTSYLDEAARCGSVLLLSDGRPLYQGPPAALSERLAGRTVLASGGARERRHILARALKRPEIIDGVIQGQSVRLVVAEDAKPPAGDALGDDVTVAATPPRFEDGFVALLGGAPKGESPLAGQARPPQVGDVAVEAQHLTKRFGDFTAADDISFTIRPGEVFGLLGPNGAGKSTTFRMMCGLLRPSAGTARVAGLDLYVSPAAARARIGYMAQKFSLYGDLSVRQNLDFFAGVYGLNGARRREAVARMVAAFALKPFVDSSAGLLPLGFKQRLALACAVMHDPAVVFLDEPTSGVDPLIRREFWGHINAMVERGVTIMVTTHFMDEAEYCDRIALVSRGRVIATGAPDALKAQARSAANPDPSLEDAFIALVEARERKEAA